MEKMRDQIAELVRNTVDDVNEEMELTGGPRVGLQADAVLYGAGATIDSLTLVALIVAVEHNIRHAFGVSVVLANEKALSMQRSPFRTLDSLIEYAAVIVDEAQKG